MIKHRYYQNNMYNQIIRIDWKHSFLVSNHICYNNNIICKTFHIYNISPCDSSTNNTKTDLWILFGILALYIIIFTHIYQKSILTIKRNRRNLGLFNNQEIK